jgi:hypothetical protein
MKIVLRRFLVSAQIGALVALAPAPSFAEDDGSSWAGWGWVPKVVDIHVIRPLGFVKLAVGIVAMVPATVIYSFRLPFDQDTSMIEEAADLLIVEPANYVFRRPLGEELAGE